MAFEEYGLNDEVLNIVSEFVGGTSLEIQVILNNLWAQVYASWLLILIIEEKKLLDWVDSEKPILFLGVFLFLEICRRGTKLSRKRTLAGWTSLLKTQENMNLLLAYVQRKAWVPH